MTSTLSGAARFGQDAPSLKQLAEALKGKAYNGYYVARCPAHDDDNASLSLREEDGKVLVRCHRGCSQEAVIDALRVRKLWPERIERAAEQAIVYDYVAENGALLFQTVRFPPKEFRQRRPDGKGRWVWNLRDVRLVPYRLPELIEAVALEKPVFIVEGEKDVSNLAKIDLTATCNACGAKKWRAEYSAFLKGADVIILPDNDPPGGEHAELVAKSLHGSARRIRVLELPNLPAKGDVSDWLAAGGDAQLLLQLAESASDWQPSVNDCTAVEEPRVEHGDDQNASCRLASDGAHQRGRPASERGASQADVLIACAEAIELFHSPDDEAFARLNIDGHYENHRVGSKFFTRWLLHEFFKKTGRAPNGESIRTALKQVEARAFFEGARHPVHLRIAEHRGNIYIDLCDDGWRAVEITPNGWQIISEPPVRFIRSRSMQPLPDPQSGGNLLEFRQFVKAKSKDDFALMIAWLLGAYRPEGPYPILALHGEQGSAKSTTATLLRTMIDPSSAPLRTLPREERDLFINAKNSRVLAFDNVSSIPEWLSDALCRMATGGGFSTRQLFTDADEQIIEATRPILLTSIEACIDRADLADRALPVELARIDESNREALGDIMGRFNVELPRMLGSLCSALAHGLRHLPETRLNSMPRMADFARWVVACELALWREARFMAAYRFNRADNNESLIEADARCGRSMKRPLAS
jgi:hypothetical protein